MANDINNDDELMTVILKPVSAERAGMERHVGETIDARGPGFRIPADPATASIVGAEDMSKQVEFEKTRAVILDRLRLATLLVSEARGATRMTPELRETFRRAEEAISELREYHLYQEDVRVAM